MSYYCCYRPALIYRYGFQSMDKNERAPFEERAKREKADGGACGGQGTTHGTNRSHERYTSHGIPFSELDRQKMCDEHRAKYIDTRIIDFVNGLSYPTGLFSYFLSFFFLLHVCECWYGSLLSNLCCFSILFCFSLVTNHY